MPAGLYTANRTSVQTLLGRREDILAEEESELRYFIFANVYFSVSFSNLDIFVVLHIYFS